MSDVWLRVGLIAVTFSAAIVTSRVIRRREKTRPIDAGPSSLAPGIYLFSSGNCLDCGPAREAVEQATGGPGGFTEIRWEDSPEAFRDLGIETVPATVLVSDNGLATVYPGRPRYALRTLGP